MKIKYFFLIALLGLLLTRVDAVAQEEPKRQIELTLTDPSTQKSQTYQLTTINYMLSNPYYSQLETKPISDGSCSLSFDLGQEMDPFLLKWISGDMKDAKGVINIIVIGSTKKPRVLAFTGGTVAGSSESFVSYDFNSSTQLSIMVKTFTVDNVLIYKPSL